MEETQQLGRLRFRGRPALRTGPKKPPNKYRNVHVFYKMKQSVIDSFDEVGMAATLAKHFPQLSGTQLNTTRKKLYGWLKHRAHIRQRHSPGSTKNNLLGGSTPCVKTTAIDADQDEASFAASWSGQDTQGDGDAALAKFSARVAELVREHSIDVIYNADQTGVNYEYLPTKQASG
ncbi:hypothetical protein H257_12033 [Aphanomyces astaci]|uniref:Uncharacterized protein n=1 Tax=Aphanomyces astaci TaxID=112090 RepID=W4G228_APHAT|nr:hypothetical protein H257_12033 [Aphanomyces astaci]ETV72988.1 hypothetical protein H257_12033 [Aphanomyces astaci]|eukprot:XP_009837437.1 hypothetical protein H257_12033 [Aphanomyces astaci]